MLSMDQFRWGALPLRLVNICLMPDSAWDKSRDVKKNFKQELFLISYYALQKQGFWKFFCNCPCEMRQVTGFNIMLYFPYINAAFIWKNVDCSFLLCLTLANQRDTKHIYLHLHPHSITLDTKLWNIFCIVSLEMTFSLRFLNRRIKISVEGRWRFKVAEFRLDVYFAVNGTCEGRSSTSKKITVWIYCFIFEESPRFGPHFKFVEIGEGEILNVM